MNQRLKTTLLAFFALTTLGTGILAWQQNRMLHNLGGDTGGSDDSAALRKKLADAEHRARALKNELDALQARQAAEATPADEPPPPPNDGDGPRFVRGGRGGPDAFRELMNDPKVVALMNAREKQQLDQRYAQLFKSLIASGKLTPEQVEAFKNLMVERQNTMRDIRQSAREQGITDRSQVDALVKSTQAELDAQLQNTLGPAAYAEYQAYEKTFPQRNFVNQFAQSLSYTSAPLTDAQSQQLIDILAANSASSGSQRRGGPFGGSNIPVTNETLAAAATVLNANQLAALTELQRQQQAQEALRQQLRAARQGGNTGGNTTAPTPSSAPGAPTAR